MLGSPAGPGGPTQRGGLWPLAPAPAPSATSFSDTFGKYGIYSLLPGSSAFGSALYSHGSLGRFAQTSATAFHTAHKVSDSLFTSSGYTFGAPTPPPGSPYSPVPVTPLELLAKGINSNIIIQQQPDYSLSPKKLHIQERRCEEKCCKLQKPCSCSHQKTKFLDSPSGCSRTNPVDWGPVSVKKEPGVTPCQVAEITTSDSPIIKVEITSPTQKSLDGRGISSLPPVVTSNGNIPVGIAVARQRIQHEVVSSPSLPPSGLLAAVNTTQIKELARISELNPVMAATSSAGVAGIAGGGTLLHCPNDRTAGGFTSWPVGGAHNSALATPTLWHYPAPLPMEPLVPMTMPMPPPVGFQLVRDHNTGGLLLLPTTGVEQLQQAVMWPSYHQPSSHVLLPPLPPPPLQLLSSASSDYLQTSTTLHQHTQSHSTRLLAVTTDNKRKISHPATTLIKIEADATLDQTKTLQAVSTFGNTTGTVYTDQSITPMVTTHVIYQHPTNLILSQTPTTETACRSQATSPVTCLTPPPETNIHDEETVIVQDASNQTDTPEMSEDDAPTEPPVTKIKSVIIEPEVQTEQIYSPPTVPETVQRIDVPKQKPDEPSKPDISGLELLSNSIVEFENLKLETPPKANEVAEGIAQMSITDGKGDDLGGLNLLCALAEQRIMEEVDERAERRKEKRKSRKHSDEPKSKKSKKSDRCDTSNKISCTCREDAYKTYKTKESEEEVKKFLASKSQSLCCKGDWPCMNAEELDMRMRLADLQRKYREKQRELSKLKPKKHDKKHRSRKKSVNSVTSDRSTPPPLLDKMDIPIKNNKSQELLKPPTLCPYQESIPSISYSPTHDFSESPKTSKKRKVGRPKKMLTTSGLHIGTETIVAKKPKKGNIVGYLLAAKEKLIQNTTVYSDPPRFIEETTTKVKRKKSKIRPKLRAELTMKTCPDEDDDEIIDELELEIPEMSQEPEEEMHEQKDERCVLTTDKLDEDKLRVLTAMGGLFYAGRLNAVEPPDVYSITLDGERGNRPHIMSREEILRDAIVEVSPAGPNELLPGTRLCAYWSQQYRCLYPGSVAEPEDSSDPFDCKFVSVEFDDGDSGRIAIEDIRLLPPDYPIIEYDPNPLLSLSKRRRRTSTTDERRSIQSTKSPSPIPEVSVKILEIEKENQHMNRPEETSHRERKRLKKRKRDKLKSKLLHEDKKKRKKHRCADEHCKHRKHHKKHRKHKKHHHSKQEKKAAAEEEAKQALRAIECNEVVDENNLMESIEPIIATEEENSTPSDTFPEYQIIPNPEDEVTMDDIVESKTQQSKKFRDRQESCESRSKMSAFLPARQLWGWSGKGYRRPKAKGRSRKQFYRAIQRGNEMIEVGHSAVFLSTGRPDRPYIGKIEAMWESLGTMVVKVKWFYHPEETIGCPLNLKYPGALFESPHIDENDVQTISHKCEVLPFKEYTSKLGDDPRSYDTIYDNNDIYYLAGYYDPTNTVLKMQPEIPFQQLA